MEDLEKLTEAVSLLADSVNDQNKSMKRLLEMYQWLDKRVEELEDYDRDSSINEDRYVTYPCTCRE